MDKIHASHILRLRSAATELEMEADLYEVQLGQAAPALTVNTDRAGRIAIAGALFAVLTAVARLDAVVTDALRPPATGGQ